MSQNPPETDKPRDSQTGAAKKPEAQAKKDKRQARLAEALRENLRRRKAGAGANKASTNQDSKKEN